MKKSIIFSFLASQILFFILLPVWMELTNYLHPLVIGVVWFCLTTVVLFATALITGVKVQVNYSIFHSITTLYTIGLLILLFFRPANQTYGDINLVPFETIIFYFSGQVSFLIALYNLSANIGLFVPFGVYYRYSNQKSFMKLILIALGSVTIIETLQFLTKRGSLDIDDLILNVLGVCIGFFIQPIIQKVLTTQTKKEALKQ